MSDDEWEETEAKKPTKLSAAERVLNKTSASRNSMKAKKITPAVEDRDGKLDKSLSRDSTGKLDLSQMDMAKIKELGFPVRLLFDDFISRSLFTIKKNFLNFFLFGLNLFKFHAEICLVVKHTIKRMLFC